jgi:hypothetical protein
MCSVDRRTAVFDSVAIDVVLDAHNARELADTSKVHAYFQPVCTTSVPSPQPLIGRHLEPSPSARSPFTILTHVRQDNVRSDAITGASSSAKKKQAIKPSDLGGQDENLFGEYTASLYLRSLLASPDRSLLHRRAVARLDSRRADEARQADAVRSLCESRSR